RGAVHGRSRRSRRVRRARALHRPHRVRRGGRDGRHRGALLPRLRARRARIAHARDGRRGARDPALLRIQELPGEVSLRVRGEPGSRTIAMGVAALAILLYYDFKNFQEKGLSAFAVSDARFPESFKEAATRIIKYGTLAMSGLFFLAFMERHSDADRTFDKQEYLRWPRILRSHYNGNLLFGFLAAEAALAGFALLAWLSKTRFHWKQFAAMG